MIVVFVAAVCSFLFLRVLIPLLRLRLLDQPNERSSHHQPTPRGGGIAFVVVFSASYSIAHITGQSPPVSAIPFLAIPLAVIGLLDDRLNLPAWSRYLVQLFTAALMLGFSPLVQVLIPLLLAGNLLLLFVFALLSITITAVINFTNFMDGIDGLVAGCMAVIIAVLVIGLASPFPLWALVGSLIGFLFWNWSPAKVFMGDVGSTFLGATFAGLVLQASSWSDAFGYLLVATPLLGDACICVLRRFLDGQCVLQAHRLHLFQRLNQAGWSHKRVSTFYIAGTSVLAVGLLTGGWPWVTGLAVFELLLGVWLDQHVAVPFMVASRN